MMKPTLKSHSVILSSILESCIKLTSNLSKSTDSIIPILSVDPTNEKESSLLLDTRSNLTVLDTNLKFLEIRIDSEFRNDNELFLDVVQLLESDVIPIFNQCFKLFKYITDLESLKLRISGHNEKFIELLKILTQLSEGKSFETLIGKFAVFLSKCLKYSASFKSTSYLDIQSTFIDDESIMSSSYKGSIKSAKSFDYESDYYSLVSKLDIINDLLFEFETCLDELQETSIYDDSVDDDIFGFEYDNEPQSFEEIEYRKKGLDFNYCLNIRKRIMMF